jgi:hypothetical protein
MIKIFEGTKDSWEPKDLDRVKNIIKNSDGDSSKKMNLATQMSNSIGVGDKDKAYSRAAASFSIGEVDMGDLFYKRYVELGGTLDISRNKKSTTDVLYTSQDKSKVDNILDKSEDDNVKNKLARSIANSIGLSIKERAYGRAAYAYKIGEFSIGHIFYNRYLELGGDKPLKGSPTKERAPAAKLSSRMSREKGSVIIKLSGVVAILHKVFGSDNAEDNPYMDSEKFMEIEAQVSDLFDKYNIKNPHNAMSNVIDTEDIVTAFEKLLAIVDQVKELQKTDHNVIYLKLDLSKNIYNIGAEISRGLAELSVASPNKKVDINMFKGKWDQLQNKTIANIKHKDVLRDEERLWRNTEVWCKNNNITIKIL